VGFYPVYILKMPQTKSVDDYYVLPAGRYLPLFRTCFRYYLNTGKKVDLVWFSTIRIDWNIKLNISISLEL
jgi:hypothetical protein